jgi:eukaryotic-like serine/threonine-protein kinase
MNNDRWTRIKQIFLDVCEQPPDKRGAFLNDACGDDEQIRREVDELLRADAQDITLLDANPETVYSFLSNELSQPSVPDQIGPYKVLEELGRGGMGIVYLVERADRQYKKRMALKLVKHGMDTEEVLHRFRYERQILASLEHPNIARLYDGGATGDGRPYLVMEYVEGEPITAFCDSRRLSVDDRLRLFSSVCRTVQFAHQNLIVHRDLKPSNVLVTSTGEVRLLDFGIAKLLETEPDAELPQTRPFMRFITPEYASPEQRSGDTVTTASDVYSLGIILYELLTGSHPWKKNNGKRTTELPDPFAVSESPSARILRSDSEEIFIVRQTTKKALSRLLKNDLTNIITTALQPEVSHRYQSAEQLLRDIERYLGGHPVAARPPTAVYRLRKFVGRNKTIVLSACIVLLMALLFVVFSRIQYTQTVRERDIATLERDKAREVAAFLENIFSVADPTFGTARADTMRVKDFVTGSVQRVRHELADQPILRAHLLNILGNVHQQFGMHTEARSLLEEALSLRRALFGEQHADVTASKNDLGVVLGKTGEHTAAEEYIREALDFRVKHLEPYHEDLAKSYTSLANLLHTKGEYDEAEAMYREALSIHEALYSEMHQKTAVSLSNLATILQRKGALPEAEQLYRRAFSVYENILGDEHPHVATAANNLGLLLTDQGKFEDAEILLRRALAMRQRMYGSQHPEVLTSTNNLATLLADMGNYREAEEYHRTSIMLRKQVHGERSIEVAIALNNFASVLEKTGRHSEAIDLNRDALSVAREAVGTAHPLVGILQGNLAHKLLKQGSLRDAETLYREGLDILTKTLPEDHPSTARLKRGFADCLIELARYDEAEPLLLDAYAVFRSKNLDSEPARKSLQTLYESWGKSDLAVQYGNPEP